jgi:hypothetical protein
MIRTDAGLSSDPMHPSASRNVRMYVGRSEPRAESGHTILRTSSDLSSCPTQLSRHIRERACHLHGAGRGEPSLRRTGYCMDAIKPVKAFFASFAPTRRSRVSEAADGPASKRLAIIQPATRLSSAIWPEVRRLRARHSAASARECSADGPS